MKTAHPTDCSPPLCVTRLLALGALLLATTIVVMGCSTPMNARDDANFQSYGYAADRPTVRPVRSLSNFSDSLMCMDRLFREAQTPTMLITSKQIPDYSGRVAVASKDMVITALSQMSRLSNAFRYVDYEVDIARQDTVQNLTTIMLNNNQIQLQRPALYVSGAVAYVDQNVLRNNIDIGTSASRLETGLSKNRNVTVIGMDMHLGDFRSRTLIPGLDSANEIIIGNGGQGLDLAGRIGSYGVQFSMGRDYAQGSGPAVRTLVELGMIELLGKWARVPYWQCLTLEQTHPDFQRQLRDWYDEGSPGVRMQLVNQSLVSQGYLAPEYLNLPGNSPQLTRAYSRFQADNGMVVNGVVDFTTYERALRNFVGLGVDGKLARVGWASTSALPVAAVAAPDTTARPADGSAPVVQTDVVAKTNTPAGAAYGTAAAPRYIDLQIRNIMLDRTAFETGEQIFMSATLSRASYLYCYMGSANNTVIRLLPNSTNTSGWLSANQALRIPDWMSPNPGFVMDAGSPGLEGVTCFATNEDTFAQLPDTMRGMAFKLMEGFRSLEDVEKAFAQTLGPDGYTRSTLLWQVVPKRAPPTAAPATP